MEETNLIEITVDIVSAHLSNNKVAVGDVPQLLRDVHGALSRLGAEPDGAAEKPEPAVSLRASVKPDHVVCLVCGARQKMLKRHLTKAHGMTPADYRRTFDLPASYPLVAPNYSRQRVELAKQFGLGTMGKGRGGKKKAG